jgi:hypothetical protein
VSQTTGQAITDRKILDKSEWIRRFAGAALVFGIQTNGSLLAGASRLALDEALPVGCENPVTRGWDVLVNHH